MSAAPTKTADRAGRGVCRTQRVDRDMRPAFGRLDYDRYWLGCGHDDLGPELSGPVEGARRRVDCHDPCAERGRDHDRGQPNPAAAVDGDPLAGGEPCLRCQRVKGRSEPASQGSGADEVDGVGQSHHVEVGERDDDLLGVRTGAAEAGLALIRADLPLTGPAPRTVPTAVHERRGDAISHRDRSHVATACGDHTGELVPRYLRQRHLLVAAPRVPIRAADSRGAYVDDDSVNRQSGAGTSTSRIGAPTASYCWARISRSPYLLFFLRVDRLRPPSNPRHEYTHFLVSTQKLRRHWRRFRRW